jgi:hypothetical protein
MPPKKPPFTIEQHVEWGMKLALINDELEELNRQMLHAYPGTHARPVQSCLRKLGQIRNDLDVKVCDEHDEIDIAELTTIYNPTAEQREAVLHGNDATAGADPVEPAAGPDDGPAEPGPTGDQGGVRGAQDAAD